MLTIDNQYLVTQGLREFGGSIAGMYRDPITGRGLYVWPVNQQEGVPSYAGLTTIQAEGVNCWAIPINAIIHTHPNNTTNNVSSDDVRFANDLPTTRQYMINSDGLITIFTGNASSPSYSYPSECSTLR